MISQKLFVWVVDFNMHNKPINYEEQNVILNLNIKSYSAHALIYHANNWSHGVDFDMDTNTIENGEQNVTLTFENFKLKGQGHNANAPKSHPTKLFNIKLILTFTPT